MGLSEILKQVVEEGIINEETKTEIRILEIERRMNKIKSFDFFPEYSELIGTIVFDEDEIESDVETLKIFSGFHAEKIVEHKEPDEYFAGIRANHFAIEIGWSEFAEDLDNDLIVVVTANHKGTRISKLWKTSL